jgi:hypothetical protein
MPIFFSEKMRIKICPCCLAVYANTCSKKPVPSLQNFVAYPSKPVLSVDKYKDENFSIKYIPVRYLYRHISQQTFNPTLHPKNCNPETN